MLLVKPKPTLKGFSLLALRQPAWSNNRDALRHHAHEFCRPAHFVGNEHCNRSNVGFIVHSYVSNKIWVPTCTFVCVLCDFASQLGYHLFVGGVVVTGEHDNVVALPPSTRGAVS